MVDSYYDGAAAWRVSSVVYVGRYRTPRTKRTPELLSKRHQKPSAPE